MGTDWNVKGALMVAGLAALVGACGGTHGADGENPEIGRSEQSLAGVEIEIQQPIDGSFVTTNTVQVAGRVEGMSKNAADVFINGVRAKKPGGGADFFKFKATVPVVAQDVFNPIVAELVVSGIDTGDRDIVHVIFGDSTPESFLSHEAAVIRLNDSGLDKIEPTIAAELDFDISEYVQVGEVELLDLKDFPESIQSLAEKSFDAYLLHASSAGANVGLDSEDGYLEGNASVSNVFLRLALVLFDDLFDTNEIDFAGLGCVVDLSIEEVRIEGRYVMEPVPYDPNGADPKFVAVSEQSTQVELVDLVWDFTMGVCDLPGAEDFVDEVLAEALGEDLKSMFRSKIESALSGANTAATIENSLKALRLGDAVSDLGVFVAAPVSAVDEDADGFTFESSVGVLPNPESEKCDPLADFVATGPVLLGAPAELPELNESLDVPLPVPPIGVDSAPGGVPYDLAVALSPSALNQLFKSKAECGFPETTITGLNLGVGVPLAMTITPTLAPVVTGQTGPAGEHVDLRIGGYRFELYDPTDNTFYADGSIGARLAITLSVVNGDINAVVTPPRATDIVLELGQTAQPTDDALWEAVLPQIIAALIPPLAHTFGFIDFEADDGFSIQLIDIANTGGFVSVFADLVTGSCPDGLEFDGGKCYQPCDAGYEGFQGECSEDCPEGFIDRGTSCYHDYESNPKHTTSRGIGTIPTCRSSEEKVGAFCYPRCASGYNSEGLFCRKPCPTGYIDDGVTCRKPEIIKSQPRYYRGIGSPLTCASNEQYQNGICYPKCKSGYYGSGIYCYEKGCPSGYDDNGPSCHRPMRSVWTCGTCPSGYRDDGCICTRDPRTYWKKKYYRGSGKPIHTCKSGLEKNGALCYPKCSSGYDGVASYCWKDCQSGYVDDGVTCRRPLVVVSQTSYGRGMGTIANTCPTGRYLEDGLCYTRCAAGYTGFADRCYADCPDGYFDDGLYCRMDEQWYMKDVYQREGTLPVVD
ncbi:MAG: hypothetical protein AAF500_14210 [Myxococcota bacterium]